MSASADIHIKPTTPIGIFAIAVIVLAFSACEDPSTGGTPTTYDIAPIVASAESMDTSSTALSLVQDLKIGWNLGNALDANNAGVSSETAWGNPVITQAVLTAVANAGFKAVRIPITWLGHFGTAADNYKLDSAWVNRVAEVVGYAHTAGLKAIINIHHDGANSTQWLDVKGAATDSAKNAAVTAQLTAMWTQISLYFKNHGDYLMFETMNEIQDGGWGWGANTTDGGAQYKVLNDWNQAIVTAVRATGGNNAHRLIIVPGYSTNATLTIANLVLPTDTASPSRLVVTVHFYDPNEYAINANIHKWGHGAPDGDINNGTLNTSWGQESNVTTTFDSLKATYIDAGVPVILGEYGAVRQTGYENYRQYYMEYVTKAAHDDGIVPFFWDNGSSGSGKECFGLFSRADGTEFSDTAALLAPMMKASGVTASDASYILASVYGTAPTN